MEMDCDRNNVAVDKLGWVSEGRFCTERSFAFSLPRFANVGGFKTEMCTSTSVSIRHRVKEIRTVSVRSVLRNLGRCEPHARDKI